MCYRGPGCTPPGPQQPGVPVIVHAELWHKRVPDVNHTIRIQMGAHEGLNRVGPGNDKKVNEGKRSWFYGRLLVSHEKSSSQNEVFFLRNWIMSSEDNFVLKIKNETFWNSKRSDYFSLQILFKMGKNWVVNYKSEKSLNSERIKKWDFFDREKIAPFHKRCMFTEISACGPVQMNINLLTSHNNTSGSLPEIFSSPPAAIFVSCLTTTSQHLRRENQQRLWNLVEPQEQRASYSVLIDTQDCLWSWRSCRGWLWVVLAWAAEGGYG